jgi:hypothetical protein
MTRPDNIIPIPKYSGSKSASAAGGTRHHPARTQLPLPPEPSRSVQSAPREGSFAWDEVAIWLSIFALALLGGFIGGFHG